MPKRKASENDDNSGTGNAMFAKYRVSAIYKT